MNLKAPLDLQQLVDLIVALPEINRVIVRHHKDDKLEGFYNYSLFFVLEPCHEDKDRLDFWQQVNNLMAPKEKELRQISGNPYNLSWLILKEEDLSQYL